MCCGASDSDLLKVEGVEQALGGAEAVAVGPSQQEQQAGQRLELLLQQHLQPGELLPLDEVQTRHLAHKTRPHSVRLDLIHTQMVFYAVQLFYYYLTDTFTQRN